MGTATLISPDEYLATSYHPDCDFVDGVLLERNVGEKDHSVLQGEVFSWFRQRRRALGVAAFPELRIRIRPARFRVPDVTVVLLPEPDEQVLTQAPYICVEILSPEDTLPRLQSRIDDYLEMGVPNVWVLDPTERRAWTASPSGLTEVRDGILRTLDARIALPIAELYAERD